MDFVKVVDEIANRISILQKDYVLFQENDRKEKRIAEKGKDRIALGLIEILDLLQSEIETPDDLLRIKNVASRKLQNLFSEFELTEISTNKLDELKPGEFRVLESQERQEMMICRKGYRRQGKVLRPVDVIS